MRPSTCRPPANRTSPRISVLGPTSVSTPPAPFFLPELNIAIGAPGVVPDGSSLRRPPESATRTPASGRHRRLLVPLRLPAYPHNVEAQQRPPGGALDGVVACRHHDHHAPVGGAGHGPPAAA